MTLLASFLLAGCGGVDDFHRFEGVDLQQATTRREAVRSEWECYVLCRDQPACLGYTFGTARAPKAHRYQCYLKGQKFEFTKTRGFISGIRH